MHLEQRTGHFSSKQYSAVVSLKNKGKLEMWCWLDCWMKLGLVCFRVRTVSGNHTSEPAQHTVSRDLLSVSFPVLRSVPLIHVWVQARNQLGSAVSSTINYTLSDIGKIHFSLWGAWQIRHTEHVYYITCYDNFKWRHETMMIMWLEPETWSALKFVVLLYSKLCLASILLPTNEMMQWFLFSK